MTNKRLSRYYQAKPFKLSLKLKIRAASQRARESKFGPIIPVTKDVKGIIKHNKT